MSSKEKTIDNTKQNRNEEDNLYFDERRTLSLIFWPSFLCLVYHFVSHYAWLLTVDTLLASGVPLAEATVSWLVSHQQEMVPVLWGLAIAALSYLLLYMDSAIPGVQPPSPFSPKHPRQNQRKVHLNYTVPLFTGVCIWFLMHISYKKAYN